MKAKKSLTPAQQAMIARLKRGETIFAEAAFSVAETKWRPGGQPCNAGTVKALINRGIITPTGKGLVDGPVQTYGLADAHA